MRSPIAAAYAAKVSRASRTSRSTTGHTQVGLILFTHVPLLMGSYYHKVIILRSDSKTNGVVMRKLIRKVGKTVLITWVQQRLLMNW